MNLTNQVLSRKEDFLAFINNYPSNTPVVMVNILKFKDRSGIGEETGKEAYKRYARNVTPLLAKVGGKFLWAGKVNQVIIGDQDHKPDQILIVQYPSKEAFLEMATSEEYSIVGKDRDIALEYGGLIATESIDMMQ